MGSNDDAIIKMIGVIAVIVIGVFAISSQARQGRFARMEANAERRVLAYLSIGRRFVYDGKLLVLSRRR